MRYFVSGDLGALWMTCGGGASGVVNCYFHRITDESQLRTVRFLRELIDVKDHNLELSNGVNFSSHELDSIIDYLCT